MGSLPVTREDDEESNEEVNGVQVDRKGFVHGVEPRHSLGLVLDLLDVVKSEASEKSESSPKPNVEESLGSREENGSNGDSH